ncbi:porin family protein [Vibrio natriegens]|uniref:outer membrane beta-barrel protein n=1 Tax=Vibrio natriegens TaxID=691 RepID=UPI001EFE5934|nr:outer membrane beta-barrel protein [Vibrio natriegens]MCG9700289.1 porin family protein [Vibrio natriegens]
MKKVMPLLVLGAVVASTSVQANDNWYVGVDVLNSDLEVEGISSDDSVTGLGIVLGSEVQYSENFKLALEAEYVSYGSFEKKESSMGDWVKVSIDGYAFNLNAKPKYQFSESGFYIGALAGLGVIGVDFEVASNILDANGKTDGSDVGFNYGAEVGYEFDSGVIVSGGYRASSVTIDVEGGGELDFDFDSVYVGVDYKF